MTSLLVEMSAFTKKHDAQREFVKKPSLHDKYTHNVNSVYSV